jgi:hypothetical protein
LPDIRRERVGVVAGERVIGREEPRQACLAGLG